MVSTYQRLIANRKNTTRRCLSPQRKTNNGIVQSSSSTDKANMKISKNVKSKSYFDLLKGADGQGGELRHVVNPNDTNSIAFWSSTFDPYSIYICDCPVDTLSTNTDIPRTTSISKKDFIISHILGGQKVHHDKPITCFDWSKTSCFECKNGTEKLEQDPHGRIVTCGEDCRVFVWTFHSASSTWVASPVLLQHRVSLTPLCCKWDCNGQSFAMGMNGNYKTASIEICSFDNDNKVGWTSRQIGKRQIKASVLCVAWQPDMKRSDEGLTSPATIARLVACGGCDNNCRLFTVGSTNHEGEDDQKKQFGEELAQFNTDAHGWVTSITWSQMEEVLCFTTQSATIYIVDYSTLSYDIGNERAQVLSIKQTVALNTLPLLNIQFINEITLIAGGYGGLSVISKQKDDKWTSTQNDDNNTQIEVTNVCIIDSSNQPQTISYSGFQGLFNFEIM